MMRYSQLFGKTRREAPGEMQAASHRLLYQAGYVRELAAGRYTMLTLGQRVRDKIVGIIAAEMEGLGAQRVTLPALHPLTLWERTGRTVAFGPTLMTVEDRRGSRFALGATAEEAITATVEEFSLSHSDLPLLLYQFSSKFRDEPRARGGLLRLREFLMKDAYSFHTSAESLDETYRRIFDAYLRIFARFGVEAFAVEADSGAIGGKESHEFMVAAEAGENTVLVCAACGYAANEEVAVSQIEPVNPHDALEEVREVAAPGATTIEKMTRFYGAPANRMMKSVIFKTRDSGEYVGVVLRGDRDANERKLVRLIGHEVEQASDEEVVALGTVRGFISPVGFADRGIRWFGDSSLTTARNYWTGANRIDVDLSGVNYERDFQVEQLADLSTARAGERCARCGGTLDERRAVETGHIFKLGKLYSDSMNASYSAADGSRQPYYMGCYGIGVERNMATIVEQHHDERGIAWPTSVAPYQVQLVALSAKAEVAAAAEQVYAQAQAAGLEVLYDDRDVSAGVKFNDADLIGLPWRWTVSPRTLAASTESIAVEVRQRAGGTQAVLPLTVAIKQAGA